MSKKSGTRTPSRIQNQHKSKTLEHEMGPSAFGRLKGKIKIVGDIVSPVCPPEDWQGDLNNLNSKPRR